MARLDNSPTQKAICDAMDLARQNRINSDHQRQAYTSDSIYTWFSQYNANLQRVTTNGHVKLVNAPILHSVQCVGLNIENCNLNGIANTHSGDLTVRNCAQIAEIHFAGRKAKIENSTLTRLVIHPRVGFKPQQVIKISNCALTTLEIIGCTRFNVSMNPAGAIINFNHDSPDGQFTLILQNVRLGQMIHST